MSEKKTILKRASLVGSLTSLSRIFGLLRDMVIARLFGASMATDAFFVAFRIPNVLRRLFAEGALTVSFIPIFKDAQIKGGRAEAKEIVNVVFTFLTLVVAVVVVFAIIFAPAIVKIIAGGFADPEKFELTVYLTRLTFPYLFLICLVAFSMGVLNSVGHFTAPAMAPVLLNISIITSALLFGAHLGEPVVSLSIGVVFGGVLQVLLQIPFLRREGYFPSLSFDFRNPALKKLLLLMGPALFGIAVYQLNIFISTIIASYLPEGSVSYLYYADRFFQLPLGIFVISMATALLPTMSEQVSTGRLEDMHDSITFSIKVMSFITLPAAAGLFALSVPLFSLFFQRGAFDYDTTLKSADALRYYAVGLWAIGGVKMVVPAFYAMQDMKTPVRGAFAAFISNVLLSLLLMGPLLHGGLALATSLSSLINLAFLIFVIRERAGKIIDRVMLSSFMKSLLASCATGVVASFVSRFADWSMDGNSLEKIIVVTAAIAAGVITYIISSFLLRSDEATYVMKEVKVRIGRRCGNA
ncbi:MAG: murein biosynthesis integral membrane protein MurJ [bacterium]|nr:murein biosynthesis integral membrane protein MurJ [bacterium]